MNIQQNMNNNSCGYPNFIKLNDICIFYNSSQSKTNLDHTTISVLSNGLNKTKKTLVYITVCHAYGINKCCQLMSQEYLDLYNIIHISSHMICELINKQNYNPEMDELFLNILKESSVVIYQSMNPNENNWIYKLINTCSKETKFIKVLYLIFDIARFSYHNHKSWIPIINLVKNNESFETIINKFNNKLIVEYNNSTLDNEISNIQNRERYSDIKISDYIKKNYKKHNLFFQPNHPNTRILSQFSIHILNILNLNYKCNILIDDDIGNLKRLGTEYYSIYDDDLDYNKNTNYNFFNKLILFLFNEVQFILETKKNTDSIIIANIIRQKYSLEDILNSI